MELSSAEAERPAVTKVELGCGSAKREGFFGIDILSSPCVDLVMDFERERLPFDDDSIEYIYTSHSFEHITKHPEVLREIMRVCRHGATVEIWTPYGKSDDGLLFGHVTFFSEASFKHICFEYDRFYLGEVHGYFEWYQTHYNLHPGIIDGIRATSLSLDFALAHMFNVALEWGVFLRVRKDAARAPGPQLPKRIFSVAGRQSLIQPENM